MSDYELRRGRQARPESTPIETIEGFLDGDLAVATIGGHSPSTAMLRVCRRSQWIQALCITGAGGAVKLDFDGEETADIDFDATAAEVLSALEALPNVEPGDLECHGGPLPDSAVSIIFRTNNVEALTVASDTLTGDGARVDLIRGWGYAGAASGGQKTITNRSTSFSADEGDYLVAGKLGSEWRPMAAGADAPIQSARVTEPLFNGTGSIGAVLQSAGADVVGGEIFVSKVGVRGFRFTDDIIDVRQIGGDDWCQVGSGYSVVRGVLDSSLTTSVTMSVWTWNGSAKVDSGDNLTVHSSFTLPTTVPSGTQVVAHEMGSAWFAFVEACP